MANGPQARLKIHGHIPRYTPTGIEMKHIDIHLVLDEDTGYWEVRKAGNPNGPNEPVDPKAPDRLTYNIIHELGIGSPCYIRTSRGLIRIC